MLIAFLALCGAMVLIVLSYRTKRKSARPYQADEPWLTTGLFPHDSSSNGSDCHAPSHGHDHGHGHSHHETGSSDMGGGGTCGDAGGSDSGSGGGSSD